MSTHRRRSERKAEQLRAEIRQDLEAVDAYMAKHGSFAEMVRQHYRDHDKDSRTMRRGRPR
jgi:hypothetical protein